MKIILIVAGVVALVCIAYLRMSKHAFCDKYALSSYRYGMAESDESREEAYKSAYDQCKENYLKRRIENVWNKIGGSK